MLFLSPLVLTGLAAVGIPIAIHLMNRLRVRHLEWGAMRFLRQATQKQSSRRRIEDILLLLARCLVVALLVLAFARPVLNPSGTEAGTNIATVSVLMLDQSASMGQTDGAQTRLDCARESAGQYLDTRAPGSSVALLPVTSPSAGLLAPFGTDLSAIRRELAMARPTAARNDWPAVLKTALAALHPYEGLRREIVIFTDNQATGWENRELLKPLLEAEPGISVRVVPVGAGTAENLAVLSLEPENALPSADQPFACLAEVKNFGAVAAANVRVVLAADSEAPSDEFMVPSIGPGQVVPIRLSTRFAEPGFHTVTVALPPDGFPADDARSIALPVMPEMRVAILTGPEADGIRSREAFFIANALLPLAPGSRAGHFLKVHTHDLAWLSQAPLERESAVVLANPGTIEPAAAERLRTYVERGGLLLAFPGKATDSAQLNESLAGILPATLGPARDAGSPPLLWEDGGYTHPVAALWNARPDSSLGSVAVTRYFPLTARDAGALAVVRYRDGSPAVVEGSAGEGRAVLFSAPPNTKWTNLPLHPNFVPLMQRLVGYLFQTRDSGRLLVEAGGLFRMPLHPSVAGRTIVAEMPGSRERVTAGQVARVDTGAQLVFQDTLRPGAYRFFFEVSDIPVAAFAVQVPTEESDLRSFVGDPLNFAAADATAGKAASTAPAATSGHARRELWGILLLLAAIVAAIEMVMAHRHSHRT